MNYLEYNTNNMSYCKGQSSWKRTVQQTAQILEKQSGGRPRHHRLSHQMQSPDRLCQILGTVDVSEERQLTKSKKTKTNIYNLTGLINLA